ncbi:MAG TPA: hypothetical protein VGX21_00365 [Methylomirabilota bacterium]|jgi:uncharacterized damage-inducible protein DinB|nr:hypothetical protein [Methylomirabilota bacterium]
MRELIGPLVDYNYWANRRLLEVVAGLPPAAFTREIGPEFSFPRLQGMLGHIMGAAVEIAERGLCGYVDPLTHADLARVVEYQTTAAQGRQTYRTER